MNRKKQLFVLLVLLLTGWSVPMNGWAANPLYSFAHAPDGMSPHYGAVTLSGSILYGMTQEGGEHGLGVVYRANADGTGYTVLHSFNEADGKAPFGSLTLSGSTLYGMTNIGGAHGQGVIFRIDTDGSDYTVMHSFTYATGAFPYGDLTLSGSTLYGMTSAGGASGEGVVFTIGTNGSGYTVLHAFNSTGGLDGASPYGSLTLSGTKLYGMTNGGGAHYAGVIFSLDTAGPTYTVLFSFNYADGGSPYGSLTLSLSGTTLYGMTSYDTATGAGVIFSFDMTGSTYTVLHRFSNATGAKPYGNLTLSGSTLYGMTNLGGPYGQGVIFSCDTSGSLYTVLHAFSGGDSLFGGPGGSKPYGSLTLSGSTLYGMTSGGGETYSGVIFSCDTSGSPYTVLHALTVSYGRNPQGGLVLSGSKLYGMTPGGGPLAGYGVIFSFDTASSTYTVLHAFNSTDGASPYGSLTLSGSILYGMTSGGGAFGGGVVFKMNVDGSGYEVLHSFNSSDTDGTTPYGSLVLSGSTLYGMTSGGGDNHSGVIFKIGVDGSGYDIMHSFGSVGGDGANPYGSLVLSGSTLYGMTSGGGMFSGGMIFQIKLDGFYSTLHSFDSSAGEGVNPRGDLTLSGSVLFGMTVSGGASSQGTVFAFDTTTYGCTVLHSFGSIAGDGVSPYGSLTLLDGMLYGMTFGGGSSSRGVIFKLSTTGTDYALLNSFNGADGANPCGSLTLSGSTLYGTAVSAGAYGYGTLFSFTDNPTLVGLVSFKARRTASGGVMLRWRTSSEIDNAGFHVWKSSRRKGPYTRITESLIPAEGGATFGADYRYLDRLVSPGGRTFYKLEDVDLSGQSAFHGPVSVLVK